MNDKETEKNANIVGWVVVGLFVLMGLFLWLSHGTTNRGCDTSGGPSFKTEQCP